MPTSPSPRRNRLASRDGCASSETVSASIGGVWSVIPRPSELQPTRTPLTLHLIPRTACNRQAKEGSPRQLLPQRAIWGKGCWGRCISFSASVVSEGAARLIPEPLGLHQVAALPYLGGARRRALLSKLPAQPPSIPAWMPLSTAAAYVATLDESFAMEVELDRASSRSIASDFALRRARGDAKARPGVETAGKAWRVLRDLVSDGKVQARGVAVDRRGHGPNGTVDRVHPRSSLPPEQAADLVLADQEDGDTWLRPESAPHGQGRFWKNVTVHRAGLKRALSGRGRPEPKLPPQQFKIKKAYDAEIADGASPSELSLLRPVELRQRLSARMKSLGLKDEHIPEEKAFRTFRKRHWPGSSG